MANKGQGTQLDESGSQFPVRFSSLGYQWSMSTFRGRAEVRCNIIVCDRGAEQRPVSDREVRMWIENERYRRSWVSQRIRRAVLGHEWMEPQSGACHTNYVV